VNRRFALTPLAVGLACAFAAITAHAAGAAEPTPQSQLTDALLCKRDPLAIVQKLAASGSSHFDQGYAATTIGEEMDEINVVILRSPLEIAGAKTSAVLQTLAQGEDFGGLVYGRFRGDYRKVVSALKLAPTPKKEGLRLGQFTKALPVDSEGHPEKVCPMTIALTPQGDGTFLLGCGWCNG
jgi:hypothetical protein